METTMQISSKRNFILYQPYQEYNILMSNLIIFDALDSSPKSSGKRY